MPLACESRSRSVRSPYGDAGQVRVEPVAELQRALVAQLQDADGDEGLGDRADAVLQVRPGRQVVERRDAAVPDQLAVADHPADDRGQPSPGLLAGEQHVEPPRGTVGQGGPAHACAGSAASVASGSANASGDGHEQTRCRSPYAWSMRATGGQYLSGSGPAGNAASSRV